MYKTRRLAVLSAFCLILAIDSSARTLREAYELAGPADGYDKYVELETGEVYTGGLLIGPSLVPFHGILYGDPGLDVRIVGNGATLDLQGQRLCISYCSNSLDIDDCIVINGDIRYRGLDWGDLVVRPVGSVRHVTFYGPHDYGVKLQGAGPGITLERNLVVNAVDTGLDFIYMTGISSDWIPTGSNIALSAQTAWAVVLENWSFHSDEEDNQDLLAHFAFL